MVFSFRPEGREGEIAPHLRKVSDGAESDGVHRGRPEVVFRPLEKGVHSGIHDDDRVQFQLDHQLSKHAAQRHHTDLRVGPNGDVLAKSLVPPTG